MKSAQQTANELRRRAEEAAEVAEIWLQAAENALYGDPTDETAYRRNEAARQYTLCLLHATCVRYEAAQIERAVGRAERLEAIRTAEKHADQAEIAAVAVSRHGQAAG